MSSALLQDAGAKRTLCASVVLTLGRITPWSENDQPESRLKEKNFFRRSAKFDCRLGRARCECGTLSLSGRRLKAGVNKLEETEPETQRTGAKKEWNRGRVGRLTVAGSNEETNGDTKFFETLGGARKAMPSTNGHTNQWRERNWLPERYITRNRNWRARPESP